MKKAIIITGLSIIGLTVLIESRMLEALVSLLLAGAVPGTSFTIPSGVMLVILVSVAWLTIFRFVTTAGSNMVSKQPTSKRRLAGTKKQLPKRVAKASS